MISKPPPKVFQLQPVQDPFGESDIALTSYLAANSVNHSYDVPNMTCQPFPYPLDTVEIGGVPDPPQFYPVDAGTDFSGQHPQFMEGGRTLHQILRLR